MIVKLTHNVSHFNPRTRFRAMIVIKVHLQFFTDLLSIQNNTFIHLANNLLKIYV